MKNSGIMILKVLAILLATSIIAYAEELQGRVVGVTDGDTVTLLTPSNNQYKIRLMGIDAPEKRQAFGQQSRQALSKQVFSKWVTVQYSKKDRYGRTIGKILANGTDVNLGQLRAGLAWHYKKYQSEQTPEDQSLYAQAEYLARTEKIGLWADPTPTAPWNWRKHRKMTRINCEPSRRLQCK